MSSYVMQALVGHDCGPAVNAYGRYMRENRRVSKGSFPDRLRDAMAKEGIKGPVQLGKRLKVNKQTASKWINGQTKNLSANDLFKIALGLQVAARWLWRGEGPMLLRSSVGEEEERCMAIFHALPPAWRDDWLHDGRRMIKRLEATQATIDNPFPKASVK